MKRYTQHAKLMGSMFEFVILADSDELGTAAIQMAIHEIQRIEDLLSEFKQDSQTTQLNQAAGHHAVKVDKEVYQLITRSLHLSKMTQGAFDITAAKLRKLYNFKAIQPQLPNPRQIKAALQKVGYKFIQLKQNNRILLSKKGMYVNFAAIGKGYAADRVRTLLKTKGILGGIINASGDLTVWGNQEDGSAWKAGIGDPMAPTKILCWLPLKNSAIATSGDYEQFFELNGKKYAHNIDPKTGYPTIGIQSVSVISKSAELADALATAVFVMGIQAGLFLIHQIPRCECLIIDQNNKIHTSNGLEIVKGNESNYI